MRPVVLKLFFTLAFFGVLLKTLAQTCNGSLGDPVIDQSFGAGPNPGSALAPGITNMTYTTSNDPQDGYYTIANSLTAANNTHTQTWWDVPSDHTGNPNGYMMIINADVQPNIFFTQAANGLCPGTTYFFSAYIFNLMIPGPITINYSHPNITFSVETTGGQVLATNNTGVIPAYPNGGKWVQYGLFFNLPANISDVVVVMTNNAPGGNGNDFVMDDVTFQACGPIIEEGFSATSGPATKGICQGSNEVFTLKGGVIGNGTPSYQWQWNYHNVGWSDISGKNADSLNIGFVDADTGTYQYRLGVANGSGITVAQCRVYSPPLTVIVSALPVVPPIASQTICEGEPFRLNAFGGSSYTWTGPGISATSQNPLIINSATTANSGTFSVVAVSDSGCAAQPVLALVNVLPKIAPVVSQDVAFCAGESTRLTASGGLYYKWSPSTGLDNDTLASPMATPLQTTTYTVAISNGVCSDSSHSVTVTVNQNPVASAGSEIILIEGQSAQLHGTIAGDNITGFSWSPTTFLTDTASQTPVTTPTSDITYTLTAVSQSCGTSTSTVFVRVYKKITVPNTFSPNNDGINDVWNIDALVTYPESVIQVFDRYGQQVFRSTGYSKPWDGKYNGSVLPAGTYYYIIDLKNNTPKISGWVLIVK